MKLIGLVQFEISDNTSSFVVHKLSIKRETKAEVFLLNIWEPYTVADTSKPLPILFCARKLETKHYNYFIFGHRHLPMIIKVGENSERIFWILEKINMRRLGIDLLPIKKKLLGILILQVKMQEPVFDMKWDFSQVVTFS